MERRWRRSRNQFQFSYFLSSLHFCCSFLLRFIMTCSRCSPFVIADEERTKKKTHKRKLRRELQSRARERGTFSLSRGILLMPPLQFHSWQSLPLPFEPFFFSSLWANTKWSIVFCMIEADKKMHSTFAADFFFFSFSTSNYTQTNSIFPRDKDFNCILQKRERAK